MQQVAGKLATQENFIFRDEEGAQSYIERNKHKPHIYVESLSRNTEMKAVRELNR
jgi:hypothetical protein